MQYTYTRTPLLGSNRLSQQPTSRLMSVLDIVLLSVVSTSSSTTKFNEYHSLDSLSKLSSLLFVASHARPSMNINANRIIAPSQLAMLS